MSNIQTGAERMPHDLSHLGFPAGQISRLITISTTPVIAGDSFEMDAAGALRLSPLRRGLAIDSTVDIFTFYVMIRLRSLRLLRVSGIVMRLRMFLLLITFLKASHSFRNRLLVICKNAYLFATMIMTSVSSPFSCC